MGYELGRIAGMRTREARELDEGHPEARRLNGAEIEGLQAMIVTWKMCEAYLPNLEALAEATGAGRANLRRTVRMIRNLARRMTLDAKMTQLKAMADNMAGCSVMITNTQVNRPGQILMDLDDAETLARAALEEKCAYQCSKSAKESRRCPVREALDKLPGMRDRRKSWAGECPYQTAGGGGADELAI